MTEYSGIKGTRVRYLSSDVTLNDAAKGQIWYNSTTGKNKSFVEFKAWSSGANMPVAKRALWSAGTQTAALGFGGYGPGVFNTTEEYYGFNWATGGAMNTPGYHLSGAGTQTAAVAFARGTPTPVKGPLTEEYNGSSWSEQPDMGSARYNATGWGTQTAAVCAGGGPGQPTMLLTEEYDGSSWTNSSNYPTKIYGLGSAGTQTAGLGCGGYAPDQANQGGTYPGNTTLVCHYDGSSWTTSTPLITVATGLMASGTQTNALQIGGVGTINAETSCSQYDGIGWTSTPSMANNRQTFGASMTSAQAAVAFGGPGTVTSGNTNATEEYNSTYSKVTTTAAWSAGGNYPGPVYSAGSSTNSPSTASVAFGGYVSGSKSSATNEYNGSSWTSANAMSDTFTSGAYGGTQTAAFGAGGYANPPSRTAATEEYDGTNWTAGGNLSVAASQNVGFGTLTAGVVYGGEGSPDPAIKTSTQEYDGSSWTTVNTMPVGASGHGTGFGTQTAGVRNSGTAPTPNPSTWDGGPAGFVNITLLYDGTNWTSGAFSNWGGRNSTGFGIQTSGVSCGGEGAPGTTPLVRTEQYDGTSWSDVATLPRTNNSYSAGFGASSGSGAVVGGTGPTSNSTDEFTGQVSADAASNLTTS